MRLHRFFVNETLPAQEGATFVLRDEGHVHQITHVFRMKKGEKFILLDNSGWEYVVAINNISDNSIECEIATKRERFEINPLQVTLVQAILKKDRFEWLVEKATELGVAKIVPCVTSRTEKKGLDIERIRKIAREAAEQSDRTTLPEITESVTLKEAATLGGKIMLLDFEGKEFPAILPTSDPITLFVGPEGGWTKDERNFLIENSADVFVLGARTLRAETAAIAAVSKLLL